MKDIWTLRPGGYGTAVQIINDNLIATLSYYGDKYEHRFHAKRNTNGCSDEKWFDSMFKAIYWMKTGKTPTKKVFEVDDKDIWSDYAKYYKYLVGASAEGYIFLPDEAGRYWKGYYWSNCGTDAGYFYTEEDAGAWIKERIGGEHIYERTED